MKTKSIGQTITLKARPQEVYDLLMDSRKQTAITGGKTSISRRVSGKFAVFDGYCHGHNIELKEGKKIVQAWHFAEDGWPADHFSICSFVLIKVPTGTKLKFKQSGIPEHKAASLKNGWKQYYWEPMNAYFSGKYPNP